MQDCINKLIKKGYSYRKSLERTRRIFASWLDNEINNNSYIYFATFTLNDAKLNNFNRNSFVRYLQRQNINAILYNDYGEKNNRLHFHGFISLDNELDLGSKKNRKDYFNKWGHTKFMKAEHYKMIDYCVKYSTKYKGLSMRVLKIKGRK